MTDLKLLNNFSIKGNITASIFDTRSRIANDLEKELVNLLKQPRSKNRDLVYKEIIKDLEKYAKIREYEKENIIVTVGRAAIASRLAGVTTYTGIINYGALGSGSTTPVNGNTQLGTEVFRKTVASANNTNNIAFIDFFYTKADTNGTYEEFGTFIDGTATANSGQLFTHLLTGGWVKTASESMTVACQYTLT